MVFKTINNRKVNLDNNSRRSSSSIGKSNGIKISNTLKLSKPTLWVDGVPLKIIVDEDRISVTSVRYNKDENRYFHNQDLFSSGGATDPFTFKTKDIEDEFNEGKPFTNSKTDQLKLALVAGRKSGIGLGSYKQFGETKEELEKMGVLV